MSRIVNGGFLAMVVLAGMAAGQVAPVRPGATRQPGRPNVLLVTIDTVRADRIGCYGAKNVKTPTIDALARDGIVFERALTQVPLTWPSHVAILTGTYPVHNGVQDFTGQPLAADFRTVAQSFQDHGYATSAVVSSFVLDRSWGLARGFAHYDDEFSGNAFLQSDPGLVERRAEESVSRAIAWLNRRPAKAFFLWLHLYDPHSPYDPPEPFHSEYRNDLYGGEIAYADSQLGRVIAWLKEHHVYDNTVVVVLSDHGESLGEHGEKEHGFFLYQATLHVPLVIKPSGNTNRGMRVDDVVEITAVAPTLLKLAGITDRISAQFDTAPLLPKPKLDAAYSETMYPFSSFGWSPLHSLEAGDYHYIEAPRPELYNLRKDPRELHNLASEQPATAAELKQKLSQRMSARSAAVDGNRAQADESVTEKLRALGYLAYRSPVPAAALDKPLPDPKDKVGELETILQASDAFRAGNYTAGEQLLKQVQAHDPQLYVVSFMLGEAALRQQKWAEAIPHLEHALQLNPGFDQAMTALARALHEQHRDADARALLQKALAANPRNFRAWYELGWVETRDDPQQAADAFQKAVDIQPNFAPAIRDLGLIEMRAGNYASAAQTLQRAVDLGLGEPRLLNVLGIAYSRTGRLQDAVKSYREALRHNPDLAEAHLNLGFAYERLQQPVRASKEYAAACRLDANLCQAIQKR